ncbi:MAG: hypothetical protein HUK22_01665, partial [Thermoguttaceae bacterium]|nr:hypothetical protein [Thermoguttaceae bacterium]
MDKINDNIFGIADFFERLEARIVFPGGMLRYSGVGASFGRARVAENRSLGRPGRTTLNWRARFSGRPPLKRGDLLADRAGREWKIERVSETPLRGTIVCATFFEEVWPTAGEALDLYRYATLSSVFASSETGGAEAVSLGVPASFFERKVENERR